MKNITGYLFKNKNTFFRKTVEKTAVV